jgi:hypothetical protein
MLLEAALAGECIYSYMYARFRVFFTNTEQKRAQEEDKFSSAFRTHFLSPLELHFECTAKTVLLKEIRIGMGFFTT